MEKFEFWYVLMNDSWEEAVIFGGHTAQEAENKAETFTQENPDLCEYGAPNGFPASFHS